RDAACIESLAACRACEPMGILCLSQCLVVFVLVFFFSSRRRHTRSVSAFLLNRSSDLPINILCRVSLFLSMALCLLLRLFVFRLLRLKRFSTLTLKVL